MHPQQSSIQKAIDALKDNLAAVGSYLSDPAILGIRTRIENSINQDIGYLSALIGAETDQSSVSGNSTIGGPLTKIMGKVIPGIANLAAAPQDDAEKKNAIKADQNQAQQNAAEELKATIERLLPEFPGLENEAILDTYSDLEIRGIAKKVGLPVTETNPAKIDSKFIDTVKAAIKKNEDLANKGK